MPKELRFEPTTQGAALLDAIIATYNARRQSTQELADQIEAENTKALERWRKAHPDQTVSDSGCAPCGAYAYGWRHRPPVPPELSREQHAARVLEDGAALVLRAMLGRPRFAAGAKPGLGAELGDDVIGAADVDVSGLGEAFR